MKVNILNWGVAATHDAIEALTNFGSNRSVSDYDAFVFDPFAQANLGLRRQDFDRRQREIRDLVSRNGGIVVCLLRPEAQVIVEGLGNVGCYNLLEPAAFMATRLITEKVRNGESTRWSLRRDAGGAAMEYFRVLQREVRVEGFLEASIGEVGAMGGNVLAENSAAYPVCVEFVVGAGRLSFVPVPRTASTDRVGAAIKRVVDAHLGGPTEIEAPAWIAGVTVPGAHANDGLIEDLELKKGELEMRISTLEKQRDELFDYRSLLFGYGKSLLEPVVRKSFAQFGFEVPEKWNGEWDFELLDPTTGSTAIGEVEGTDGPVDVDKYRQLLDYFQAEILEGRTRKPVLVGNGYRTKGPDAPERQNQFTEHVLRGAKQNGFCLMPTSELFRALCAVLESPDSEALKKEIRRSILGTVGIWTFADATAAAREARPSNPSEPSA